MEKGKDTTTIDDYLTYIPARVSRGRVFSSSTSTSTTKPQNPRDLVSDQIHVWENFADSVQVESKKALARELGVKLRPLDDDAFERCYVMNEAGLETELDRQLFRPLRRLLLVLGVYGRFEPRPQDVILDPDWSWRSMIMEGSTSTDEVDLGSDDGSHYDLVTKILIEVKTFWDFDAPDDLVGLVKSELSSPSFQPNQNIIAKKAVWALSQIYGYLSINHLQYGVLCTYSKFFFLRLPEDSIAAGTGKLEITGAISRNQTRQFSGFTLMEAWLTIIMAAERSHVITSPHASPAGKARLPNGPMELSSNLKLGNLYVGEHRTRSQLGVVVEGGLQGVIVDSGLRGYEGEIVLKIIDTCKSEDKGKKLLIEVSAYKVLDELQAHIIPKVVGFFMIHSWIMVLVLQKCGDKIKGWQFVECYEHIKSMVKQIHSEGVAHGDIALRNILIDTDGKLTIIDFSEAHLRSSSSDEDFLAYCQADLDAMENLRLRQSFLLRN